MYIVLVNTRACTVVCTEEPHLWTPQLRILAECLDCIFIDFNTFQPPQ